MEVTPGSLRLSVFLAGAALFFLVETLWPRRPWHAARSRRLLLHAGVAAFNTVLVLIAVAAPLAGLAALVRDRGWGLAGLLGLSGTPEIFASLVVLDFFDYLWHRANHTVPFLWRFHSAHHVDTHVDVTTSLRFHPGELLLSGVAKASWIACWGPSLWGYAIFEMMISAASQYHHSNTDFPDAIEPAVRLLSVTPRMHASHHSALTTSLNANFSTIFSVWDRLLGTYIEPAGEHLALQGLRFGRESDLSLRRLLAHPFTALPDLRGLP